MYCLKIDQSQTIARYTLYGTLILEQFKVHKTEFEHHWNLQSRRCFLVYLGTIAKESRPKKANGIKHNPEAETKQSPSKRDWIYGWQRQSQVPVFVPPMARSNTGFMRQDGGNNRGFVAQRKPSPALPSMTRAAGNGTSSRTLDKGSDETTKITETKKPLPALIYSVKGN